MSEGIQRLREANDRLRGAYENLVAALGGPELADAYRDALAERLRAEGDLWGHVDAEPKTITTIVEWAAIEVEREIRL